MSSPMKMTRQGVRDLDFGWKKKVVVSAESDVASSAVVDSGIVSGAGPEATAASSMEVVDGGAAWSPPAVVASS